MILGFDQRGLRPRYALEIYDTIVKNKGDIVGYEIIDNFLPEEDFRTIKDIFFSPEISWYFNDSTVNSDIKNQDLNDYQFTHTFFRDETQWSSWFPSLAPILNQINPQSILRIKANMVPRTEMIREHGWHTDYHKSIVCKTAVFYLNTNDGYTIFKESGEKVNSVENRLVVFDSDMEHSGSSCTDQKVRVVLNLNYT